MEGDSHLDGKNMKVRNIMKWSDYNFAATQFNKNKLSAALKL
jgi:hypothetical protein